MLMRWRCRWIIDGENKRIDDSTDLEKTNQSWVAVDRSICKPFQPIHFDSFRCHRTLRATKVELLQMIVEGKLEISLKTTFIAAQKRCSPNTWRMADRFWLEAEVEQVYVPSSVSVAFWMFKTDIEGVCSIWMRWLGFKMAELLYQINSFWVWNVGTMQTAAVDCPTWTADGLKAIALMVTFDAFTFNPNHNRNK